MLCQKNKNHPRMALGLGLGQLREAQALVPGPGLEQFADDVCILGT